MAVKEFTALTFSSNTCIHTGLNFNTYVRDLHFQGGFDGSTGLNTAEVLDLSLPIQNVPFGFPPPQGAAGSGPVSISGREWRPIASMSTR